MLGGLIGNVAGSALNSAFSLFGQNRANKATERMYKHRYQWQAQDLKKAGLNPMLAYMNPAPSAGQGAGANPVNFGNPVASAKQYENLKAITNTNKAQAFKAQAEANSAQIEYEKSQRYNQYLKDNPMEEKTMFRKQMGATGQGATTAFDLLQGTPDNMRWYEKMMHSVMPGVRMYNNWKYKNRKER